MVEIKRRGSQPELADSDETERVKRNISLMKSHQFHMNRTSVCLRE